MKWLKKLIIRIGWSAVQKEIIQFIKNDNFQKIIVEKLQPKKDISILNDEQTEKLQLLINRSANEIYDLVQEVLVDHFSKITAEQILEKINHAKSNV